MTGLAIKRRVRQAISRMYLTPLCLAMMLVSAGAGCNGGRAVSPVDSAASLPTTAPNPPSVTEPNTTQVGSPPTAVPTLTWIGRTQAEDAQNANIRFSWAGVTLGVHFKGTQLGVVMNDLPIPFENGTYDSYYNVTVDGQPGTVFSLTTTPQTITVVQGLPLAEHTVWISKRTEGMIGSGEFHGVVLGNDGVLLAAPQAPAHHIEMIGASADVGFGDTTTHCSGFVADQEDEDLSWPQLTANAVEAQLFNLAYSGKGLVSNLDPINDPINILPYLCQYADTNAPNSKWDFSKWKADVVLIDLGDNDLNGEGGTLNTAAFVPAYITFIQQIQAHYPGVYIYAVINATEAGSARTQLEAALKQVVATCQSMAIPHVALFEASPYTGNTFGCDGHPSAQVHQQMADELLPELRQDLGW